MAATAQAVRTETAVKQSVITSAQSLAVCRNLLKATVGQILYQRGLFDDSAFDSLKMANTTVKCLKKQQHSTDEDIPPQVHQIANCLETGVFEALEKQYLRAVVIAFQHGSTPDAPLLEAYTLKFHYSSDGEVSMILSDLEEDSAQKKSTKHRAEAVAFTKGIKSQASQMLRNVITMVHTLRPLPDQCVVTLKLYYFDHKVPQDWQPKFFQDATGQDDVLFEPDDEVSATQLGATSTMYHRIKLKAVHRKDMDLTADMDAHVQGKPPKSLLSAVAPAKTVSTEAKRSPAEQATLQVQKAILASGKIHIGSLAKELGHPVRTIQQACARLEQCGFLARKLGPGTRFQIADAGAQPSPKAGDKQPSQGDTPVDPAHLNAMWLLCRLHDIGQDFVTARQVIDSHGIADKAIAAATLVWLEKQGCLRRCKATIKGREVLKTKSALAKLGEFRHTVEAAGEAFCPPSLAPGQEDLSSLVQEAAARHKAQVAAMYASAEAARQAADETPHTVGGSNPSNHSANRNRTYAGVTKAQAVESADTVKKLARHETQKLCSNGALPPAAASSVPAAATAVPAGASEALSPLNVTEGIETPGLSEQVPAKRSRNGLCGQRSVITAVAAGSGTTSPPDSVSKTMTRTGRAGRRPRTSTVSMAVRQPRSSGGASGRGGGRKRSRSGSKAAAEDDFAFTD